MDNIETIEKLISVYKKLPGVGYKTAERLAYATLNLSFEEKQAFIDSLHDCQTKVKKCPNCGVYFEERCPICSDVTRDKHSLLVVTDSKNIFTIEKTGGYQGLYFSLNGTLSPLKNRTPASIGIPALERRIEEDEVKEVILALPTDLEGETTALYIANMYKGSDVVVTSLARGIPMGTDLEYLDERTISSSIKGRVKI